MPSRFFSAADARRRDAASQESVRGGVPRGRLSRVAEGQRSRRSGGKGSLLVTKRKSARVTCAIAEAPDIIDRIAHRPGARKAGDRRHRTGQRRMAHPGGAPAARNERRRNRLLALSRSRRAAHRACRAFRLGARLGGGAREAGAGARCRRPLRRAHLIRRRRHLRDGEPCVRMPRRRRRCLTAARRAEIVVSPGISAMQAAAARAGAPLGHDFCAISLSDLLTPWETIEAPHPRRGGRRLRHRILQSRFRAAAHAARGGEDDLAPSIAPQIRRW